MYCKVMVYCLIETDNRLRSHFLAHPLKGKNILIDPRVGNKDVILELKK